MQVRHFTGHLVVQPVQGRARPATAHGDDGDCTSTVATAPRRVKPVNHPSGEDACTRLTARMQNHVCLTLLVTGTSASPGRPPWHQSQVWSNTNRCGPVCRD